MLTMGLLNLSKSMGHSYGMFGSSALTSTVNADGTRDIPTEQSYVTPESEMVDATSTPKYIIVSVWANTL